MTCIFKNLWGLLLICILLVINDSFSSSSTIQCDIFGVCKDNVLQTITVRSKELCWLKCLKEDKCNWFSFEKKSWTCNIFEICSELEFNSTFISGEKDCSYFNPLTKLLVVTGTPIDNAQYSEVIDLLDSDTKCQPLMDFPIQAYSATGGLLQNNQPLICGGYNPFNDPPSNTHCYIVGNPDVSVDLIQSRDFASSVVLNDDLLWITGGIASTEKSSSEFVSLTQHSKIGPDLPGQYSFAHCMTKVDEDLVIITGGSSNNGHNDGETLLVNPNDNFTMTPGLRFGNKSIKRYQHACGTFNYNSKKIVIVAGGYEGSLQPTLSTTEILDPRSLESGWVRGPDMPQACTAGSMITSPDGQGVILLGCYDGNYSNVIYELSGSLDGNLEWKVLPQKLNYARDLTVAMLIPDELTDCN